MKKGTRSKTSRPPRERAAARDVHPGDDVAAARRRVKERRRNRRRNIPVGNLIFVAATLVVSVSMFAGIKKRYDEYYVFRDQVVERRARLEAINKQYAAAEARLALLESNKGRAQLLVERGYVRPGERILLFPKTEAPAAQATSNSGTSNNGNPNSGNPKGGATNSERAGGRSTASAANSTGVAATPATSRWSSFWRTVRGLPPEPQAARSARQ